MSRSTLLSWFPPLAVFFGFTALGAESAPGIDNFHRVDEHVYRGAQPTSAGFAYLAKMGVKTVIDLRESGGRSRAEEKTVRAAGMQYVSVPMTGLTPPSQAEISKILALMEDPAAGPVFVHCKRGADRTGAVIASYRVYHDHWENAAALREAMADGMSLFQLPRQNYIRAFQPAALRLGLAAGPEKQASSVPVAPVAAAVPVTP